MVFSKDALNIDSVSEGHRICEFIEEQVRVKFKRKGVVVGLSGGVDSALLACLCVRALGADNVRGLILPEKESAPESTLFGEKQASALGIRSDVVDITPFLEAFGVYEKRNAVIRDVCADFDLKNDGFKIALPGDLLDRDSLNVFSLVVNKASGDEQVFRLKSDQIRPIAAAQNIKQRTRMIQLHYLAERLHFLVGGTTNRTELEQGFFVKHGDGGVDIEPLSHLFKTQVFQLAEYVGVIEEIRSRTPTPDTWPGGVTDEEFYFRIPFETLDLLLSSWVDGYSPDETARVLHLSTEQVQRAYRDFESKRSATWNLRALPPDLLSVTLDSGHNN